MNFDNITTDQWIAYSIIAFLILLLIILFFVYLNVKQKYKKLEKETLNASIIQKEEQDKINKVVVTTTTTSVKEEQINIDNNPKEDNATNDNDSFSDELSSDVVLEDEIDDDTEIVDESDAVENTQKVKNSIYHVSQNKNDKSEHFKRWRIRLQGSKKTIKYYDTQKEALDYAKSLADNNDGSVILHGLDGRIRRQNYTKK